MSVKRWQSTRPGSMYEFAEGDFVEHADYYALAAELALSKSHMVAPDILERLFDRIHVAEVRVRELEAALHKAFNQFENITVADTLETAKGRAHKFIGWYYNANIETSIPNPTGTL